MIEIYRGQVNTWECDEMGHMNVRFYVAKMMEGLAVLVHRAGMPQAFRPKSSSTILPRDQHIRFLKEIRPGEPMYMVGGVLEVRETDALIYQELRHTIGDAVSASFRTRVEHVDAQTGRPFAWSDAMRRRLEEMTADPDPKAAPRSLDMSIPPIPDVDARRDVALDLGVPVIGCGAVPLEHCDSFGRMKPEMFIGRVSDSVPNLMAAWRANVAAQAAEASGTTPNTGAAVLEYRLAYRKWPRAGDLFEVRTGLGRVEEKVHSLVHWIVDPVSGDAYCTSEAVAVTFDLNTRKVISTSPEHRASLERHAVSGLRL